MTTTIPTYKILWRPNNYRRQIEVKTKTNSTILKIKSAIKTSPKSKNKPKLTFNPHTLLLFCRDYNGITIQYGKNKLTGIYQQNIIGGHKETHLIEAQTTKELDQRIEQKSEQIRKQIDQALIKFQRQFKIGLRGKKPKWVRYEDWVKGEEYIDQIPRETIIHDTYFKKVYGEGIEFKGKEPVVSMKNYIKNRAVEDIAPEIAQAINQNQETIEKLFQKAENQIIHSQKLIQSLAQSQINANKQFQNLIKLITPREEKISQKTPDYIR